MTTPGRKEMVGLVRSDSMDKTIIVEVIKTAVDKLYKKAMSRKKRYKAHDENNEARSGDTVRIRECRPLSREKRWRLVEIVERGKRFEQSEASSE